MKFKSKSVTWNVLKLWHVNYSLYSRSNQTPRISSSKLFAKKYFRQDVRLIYITHKNYKNRMGKLSSISIQNLLKYKMIAHIIQNNWKGNRFIHFNSISLKSNMAQASIYWSSRGRFTFGAKFLGVFVFTRREGTS